MIYGTPILGFVSDISKKRNKEVEDLLVFILNYQFF